VEAIVAGEYFEIKRTARRVGITFHETLRDVHWSQHGGEISSLLSTGKVEALRLDFRATTWADPLPLLSLAAVLQLWLQNNTTSTVEVDLGRPRSGEGNRFPLFLAAQGFLRLFGKTCVLIWQGRPYRYAEIDALEVRLRRLTAIPAFQNADCIFATLLDASDLSSSRLAECVERLVEAGNHRIDRWLAGHPRQRGFLLTKLRLVLRETLDNVSEHAYPRGGVAAIYARIRTGSPADPHEFDRWNRAHRLERDYCPGLTRCNYGKHPGWLELFVCDAGRGLTHGLTRDTKAPLLTLSQRFFREALSRHRNRATIGKTQMTGLQHIGLMLRGSSDGDRGDFVRVYSAGEWIAEHLPWPDGQPEHKNYRTTPRLQPPPGTWLHFGLEPPPADLEQQRKMYPGFFLVPTQEDLLIVRQVLSDPGPPLFSPPHDFFDNYIAAAGSNRGVGANEWIKNLTSETVIIRPSRSLRKRDLIDQLEQISTANNRRVRRIVFADVPPSVAIDFSHILNEERVGWLTNLEVHVVSQDWSCASFELDTKRQRLTHSTQLAMSFLRAPGTKVGAPFVAGVLRKRDSDLFWNGVGDTYLNETVNWGPSGTSIRGYLDLPAALVPHDLFEAARRCFRRAVTAFASYRVTPCDELIRHLVEVDFVWRDLSHAPAEYREEVVVAGSVLVTGSTAQRFAGRDDFRAIGMVHLFRHSDSSSEYPDDGSVAFAMLWSPTRARARIGRKRYERVLNSPYIIRGGERAIPLPRFTRPIGKKMGRSLYGATPNDTYKRWQNLALLRMGHWVYNQNHDLLTVNLGDALDQDRLGGGCILPWVTEILTEWNAEAAERRLPWTVVYPRHPVTDKIVRLLRDNIPDRLPQIFPLQLMQVTSVSPLMVSPVERERLGQHLARLFKSGGTVVLLDDGVVSGKTIEQLSQFVEGLWESVKVARGIASASTLDIRTIALLDRSGLPTQRGLVERRVASHPRLWRWDVPPLGHKGSCPLCAILERCVALKSRIEQGELRTRLEQWIDAWAPVSVQKFENGLPPRPIPKGDATRFCIEQTDTGEEIAHEVEHLVSTSRAAIAAEICRSTTRKDYPLEKARLGRFKPGSEMDLQTRVEILATQLLLFLEELTFSERVERLRAMLDLLWRAKETSPATALAGVTVLIDPGVASALWRHCIGLIETDGFPSDDALIAAFALHQAAREPLPSHQTNKAWALLQLLVASTSSTRGSLCRLFQVFGPDANSIHQGLLLDLLKKDLIGATDIHQILHMLEALAFALRRIQPEIVVGTGLIPDKDAAAISKHVDRIRADARKCLPPGSSDTGDINAIRLLAARMTSQDHERTSSRETLEHIYTDLFVGPHSAQSKYRSGLTIKLEKGSPTGTLVAGCISELSARWSRWLSYKGDEQIVARWQGIEPLVLIAPTIWTDKNVFVYRDAMLMQAITEAISNVVHREKPIPCPWPGYDALGEADMWVRIIPQVEGFTVRVELANSAREDASPHPHQTINTIHLQNVGGSCAFWLDRNSQVYYGRIEIPTVAGLAWERGYSDEVSLIDHR